LVLSHKKDSPGLDAAQKAGISAEYFRITDWYREKSGISVGEISVEAKARLRAEYMTALATRLTEANIELVFMTGWDLILGPTFFEQWRGVVVNVHPSLLPAFSGENAWVAALEYGVKVAGVTIHFVVDSGIDTGPIILQEALAVAEGETADTLREKLNVLEDRLGPLAIKLLAAGKLQRDGRSVRVGS
ncbi:hypothetical protein HYW67_02040, partial [Candidatus Parcubacteria bacterium]|nr:hypothetical protein [Candidatus Parcubacteria bacterium]